MILINLLPYREARRQARRSQFSLLAALVALAAAVIWYFGSQVIQSQIDGQAEKNQFLRSEIASLDKQIKEIERLQSQTEQMVKRKQVIESLQSNRAEIVHLFSELTPLMPPGVYFESLRQQGNKITILGIAQSSARVSSLMRNLARSQYFENPVLLEVVATVKDKREVSKFGLIIHFSSQISKPANKS